MKKMKYLRLFESFKVFESLNSQELIDDINSQIENIVDENPAYPVMEMILNKIKEYFHGKYEFGNVEDDGDGYRIKTDKIVISIQAEGDAIVIKTSGNRQMEIIEIERTGGENRYGDYSDSYEQEGMILTLKNDGNDLASFLVGLTEDIEDILK